ncbi:MAG: 1-acyl-sn-glycerol-3-phosphate acyltransferase, partial [Anaerolineae bacterium]
QAAAPPASPAEEEKTRRQLLAELEALRKEIQALTPGYQPPPFSARRLMRFVGDTLNRYPKEVQLGVLERLRAALSQDAFDPEVWQGVWYMLNYSVQYNVDLVKRRFTGEYDTDEWGLDWEWVDVVRPFLNFLYKTYWRVEVTGLEHVPLEGRALLVANHSGQLPFDGMMIAAALLNDHPAQRLVRTLYAAILPRIPWVSTVLVRLGQTLATVDNGTRLLEQEELVAVFPEGYKGTGKPFRSRYRLARFGRGGFVQMALNTGAPIIPVSVVGSEETYISLGKFPTFAEITGIPYIPITLRFPWLGLLGVVPLPTKWYIDFGPPMPMAGYGRDAAHDMVVVSQLTDQVRNTIQQMVNQRLAQRRSIFL